MGTSRSGSPGLRKTLQEKSRDPRRVPRGTSGSARGPRPASLATSGTWDRGQRHPRRRRRPQAPPGLPAAHLRVSPPPSAPTVHPAGPGGGCRDAAPTGPRAARPGLPAPGTHRVPASPRLPGSAGRQGRKERRRGGLLCPAASPLPSCGSLQSSQAQVQPRSPARESLRQRRPSRHYSSTTDTEEERRRRQWRWRRREAGREQSGRERAGGGGETLQTSRELSGDGSAGMQPWVRAMLSVAEG